MKQVTWISSVAMLAAGVMTAQLKPKDPTQSPASQPAPKTVTTQAYPAEQIQAGEVRFSSDCGFCHGRDAAGGETGPDLTRSPLVAGDSRGDKIGPLVRAGRKDKGMPSFNLSNADLDAVVAFIHNQKIKFEGLAGGRRAVDPGDVATGNAEAGRVYFNGAGGCSGCHSPTGDLASIATRYQGLELLQRMLYPRGRKPAPAPAKVTLTLRSGKTLVAPLASESEFTIVVLDPSGSRHSYQKTEVKYKVDDPMSAHFAQLAKYTDADMHNVFAYLDTLK
jgi:cytochrome c oxidase cbb3-type subunit 3